MTKANHLVEQIAEVLRSRATNDLMPSIALSVGLIMPEFADGGSKRERARQALAGKSDLELGEIARQLGLQFCDFSLEEAGLVVLEQDLPPITEITRRDIAKCFGDELSGEQNVVILLRRLFAIDSLTDFFVGRSLADDIEQHMIRNPGDWDVEYIFERIGALDCSRDRFGRLLEAALHPLARRGPEQVMMVDAINAVLRRDGYHLRIDGEESGYPVYRLAFLVRAPTGTPKNLIFASNGPKPEIGFSDAINNNIIILSNASSCLVYDRPIKRDGLLWSELVEWWHSLQEDDPADSAQTLGHRLRESLASDGERHLFDTYFKLYRRKLENMLPALIPQVYLHYDPAIVRLLRNRAGLVRQRMDFLLLLPNSQRVVIEVDGSQHFSRDGKPSLAIYAEMVAADRDIRLAGYEIYRFGSNELVGNGAVTVIEHFFDRLWSLHKIGAGSKP